MIFAEINKNFLLIVSGQDLTDLGEGLTWHYNLMVIIVFLELDVTDRDPVSVQGNHLEKIIFYFQKFARHHLIAVIRGYGKNGLTNCFFQGKLCQTDVLVPFDVRKIRKFLTIAALDIKYCIFAFDHSIETIVRRNDNRGISIW